MAADCKINECMKLDARKATNTAASNQFRTEISVEKDNMKAKRNVAASPRVLMSVAVSYKILIGLK